MVLNNKHNSLVLVGTETFKVGKTQTSCVIKIEPVGGFTYQYTLEVGDK